MAELYYLTKEERLVHLLHLTAIDPVTQKSKIVQSAVIDPSTPREAEIIGLMTYETSKQEKQAYWQRFRSLLWREGVRHITGTSAERICHHFIQDFGMTEVRRFQHPILGQMMTVERTLTEEDA